MQVVLLASFFGFTGFAGLLTWLLTRRDDHGSSKGYFLVGRSLTFPLIAGSLLLTNLSTEQMVGLNGAAFSDGLCVMAWEVIAVVALVLMALFTGVLLLNLFYWCTNQQIIQRTFGARYSSV